MYMLASFVVSFLDPIRLAIALGVLLLLLIVLGEIARPALWWATLLVLAPAAALYLEAALWANLLPGVDRSWPQIIAGAAAILAQAAVVFGLVRAISRRRVPAHG